MGFSNGNFAKVWEVNPVSDRMTKLKISISRKNKDTGEYETRFNGFAAVCGAALASKARKLKEGDTIKLERVDVETHYDKEKKKEYINYYIYAYEQQEQGGSTASKPEDRTEPTSDPEDDSRLPY